MPICKQCHARISKFDKDICPICGCVHPLSGEGAISSDTIEFTNAINGSDPSLKTAAPRQKEKTFLLFSLIGWLGFGFSYLRFSKLFVALWAIGNIVFIGGLGAVLCFLTPLSFFGFIITLLVSYIVNIIIGLVYRFTPNIRDGKKELIL